MDSKLYTIHSCFCSNRNTHNFRTINIFLWKTNLPTKVQHLCTVILHVCQNTVSKINFIYSIPCGEVLLDTQIYMYFNTLRVLFAAICIIFYPLLPSCLILINLFWGYVKFYHGLKTKIILKYAIRKAPFSHIVWPFSVPPFFPSQSNLCSVGNIPL